MRRNISPATNIEASLKTCTQVQLTNRLIIDLVSSQSVPSQSVLGRLLLTVGVSFTQATFSRDLRALNLVKTQQGYVFPDDINLPINKRHLLSETLSQFLTEVISAQNLVVVKTNPGSARPLAQFFDLSEWTEILGMVAGDDTLLLIAKTSSAAKKFSGRSVV